MSHRLLVVNGGAAAHRGAFHSFDDKLGIAADLERQMQELGGAAPENVLSWMRRKAGLADCTRIDLRVCDFELITRVVADERFGRGDWPIEPVGVASGARTADAGLA